jgi:hypothetical protein
VIGKGDKERRVPLPDAMLAELRRLWPTHRLMASDLAGRSRSTRTHTKMHAESSPRTKTRLAEAWPRLNFFRIRPD